MQIDLSQYTVSGIISLTPKPQPPAPNPLAPPSNLVPTVISSTRVDLTWTDNSTSETGFKVERNAVQIALTAANATSYSDTGLSPSTSYTYQVRATDGINNSAYAMAAAVTTPSGGAGITWGSDGTDVGHNFVGGSVQWVHDNRAQDGDTITLPPGTFIYNTGVVITKSITVQGLTTVNPVGRTANDQTIILDNTGVNSAVFVMATSSASGIARLTGITLRPGARTALASPGGIQLGGGQRACVRLDNCHLNDLSRGEAVVRIDGAVYGVMDHNLCNFPYGHFIKLLLVRMSNWNGDGEGTGDGSFADYPWFGTEKFFFVEDNCLDNQSGIDLEGVIDGDLGCRIVVRHNHIYNVQVQSHGTEGRPRGMRAMEIYSNDFHFSSVVGLGGVRSGAYLFHDNTFDGQVNYGLNFNDLRQYFSFYANDGTGSGNSTRSPTRGFGGVGGNLWDYNVTESNGTHIDGHPAFQFASGTCVAGSGNGTIVVSGSPWATNQWSGYSVVRDSDLSINIIFSNTGNTLTLSTISGGYGSSPTWAAGDGFKIYRALVTIDQPSRGKSDPIIHGYNTAGPVVVAATGTQVWPHQALEPCYAWNNPNAADGGAQIGFSPVQPASYFLQSGRDYFNNSSASAAQSMYRAAVNGTDYNTPYTYPHPLVPAQTNPTATITSPSPGGVSGTINVTATATPVAPATIAGVQFYLDNVVLGMEDQTSPYSISWDTTTATNGAHTLTALARDSAMKFGSSNSVAVTVTGGLPVYLVNQNFELTGFDNGEAWTNSGGDPDWATNNLRGAQSLRITGGNFAYKTYSPQVSAWLYCDFLVRAFPASQSRTGICLESSAVDGSGYIFLDSTGHVKLGNNAATTISAASATTLSLNTLYHVWLHVAVGGTNTLYISTTTTRPVFDGSGKVVLSVADTGTVPVSYVTTTAGTGADMVYDHVLVSANELGTDGAFV